MQTTLRRGPDPACFGTEVLVLIDLCITDFTMGRRVESLYEPMTSWGFQPILKVLYSQNGFIFPNFRDENLKKIELPPPSLDIWSFKNLTNSEEFIDLICNRSGLSFNHLKFG